jgi:NhaP-type Na+/H+ and K+/H+ antiporter
LFGVPVLSAIVCVLFGVPVLSAIVCVVFGVPMLSAIGLMAVVQGINPLLPELNPSAQRCSTRFLLGILLLEP